MLVFYFGKSATVSVFVRSLPAGFVWLCYDQSGYLGFRTTKAKETKLTLAVIPFHVG